MPVGARVTLRGRRMWEFLDRLGLDRAAAREGLPGDQSTLFRRAGKLRARLREQTIFPEISYDSIDATRGIDVAVVTTAETDEEGPGASRLSGCRSGRARRVI
jgi:large subunit ribosomal protein L5